MSITGLILQPTIVRGAALDYFRFMNGREVRARVVQGGQPGGMAVLRMGEHFIKARIQGVSIPDGKTLFVRIEKEGGGYRLITLDKTAIPHPGSPAGNATPTELPAAVLAGFRSFMERARRRVINQAAETTGKTGRSEKASAEATPKIKLDASFLEAMGRTLSSETPETDGLMFLAWQAGMNQSNESGAEITSLLGSGDLSTEPRHYFMHADLQRLGPLGILFVSPDEQFESISVWLAPEKPATERLLGSMLTEWKEELRAGGLRIKDLALLATADADKTAGLDLRA